MYYLIEIAHGDSKIEGKGIYTYNTEREALANGVVSVTKK